MLMITVIVCSGLPWPIVDHWPFDGERAAIVVGDDQVEGRGRIGLGHALAAIKCRGVGLSSARQPSTSCP
jgi:hypothetical protein